MKAAVGRGPSLLGLVCDPARGGEGRRVPSRRHRNTTRASLGHLLIRNVGGYHEEIGELCRGQRSSCNHMSKRVLYL